VTLFEAVLLTVITASTPLLLAALGELVAERAGVLNLGVEGMMIMGAACGFASAYLTGSTFIGAACGVAAGVAMAAIFALLTLGLAANQVASGLTLRSIGDSHTSAHALGIHVLRYRYLAVLFGGACAGLAGGQLSLVYTPQWVENMAAGRGWIALALVVFASWRPWRVLAGAYIFGAVWIGQLHAQAFGIPVPSQFLSSLPYLATIAVLVLISRNKRLTMMNTPAALGQPFVPDR